MRELPYSGEVRKAMVASRQHYTKELLNNPDPEVFANAERRLQQHWSEDSKLTNHVTMYWEGCLKRDFNMFPSEMSWWVGDDELFTAFLLQFVGKYTGA